MPSGVEASRGLYKRRPDECAENACSAGEDSMRKGEYRIYIAVQQNRVHLRNALHPVRLEE